jgi:hypothetical protein
MDHVSSRGNLEDKRRNLEIILANSNIRMKRTGRFFSQRWENSEGNSFRKSVYSS